MCTSDAIFLAALLFFMIVGGLAQVIGFLACWMTMTWAGGWAIRKVVTQGMSEDVSHLPLPGWMWFIASMVAVYPAISIASIIP